MQAAKNPAGAGDLEMKYKRAKGTQSFLTSIGRYIVALLNVNYQSRAAKRRVYALRIPRGACIPSNPQECAASTHGILAILTISTSPSPSGRPKPLPTPLVPDHPSLSRHPRSRDCPTPSSVAQVHHDSLACTRSTPLYPQTLQTTSRQSRHPPGSIYAFNSDSHSACH